MNVYCHHDDHIGYGEAWTKSAGHDRSTSLLLGSPKFGALWHCPKHRDCKTCPKGTWSRDFASEATKGGTL